MVAAAPDFGWRRAFGLRGEGSHGEGRSSALLRAAIRSQTLALLPCSGQHERNRARHVPQLHLCESIASAFCSCLRARTRHHPPHGETWRRRRPLDRQGARGRRQRQQLALDVEERLVARQRLALVRHDAGVFPDDGLLAHCRIKSAESSGEASINNRKGRTFLIYEIEMKLKWAGELVDGDGKTLESGSGSLTLPDVSAESLDDLEVEFETKSRGSALSEAMRTQGVRCIKAAVQNCIKDLNAQITAQAAAEKPEAQNSKLAQSATGRAHVTPSVAPPQPIKLPNGAAQATGPPQPMKVSSAPVDVSDSNGSTAKTRRGRPPRRRRSRRPTTRTRRLPRWPRRSRSCARSRATLSAFACPTSRSATCTYGRCSRRCSTGAVLGGVGLILQSFDRCGYSLAHEGDGGRHGS